MTKHNTPPSGDRQVGAYTDEQLAEEVSRVLTQEIDLAVSEDSGFLRFQVPLISSAIVRRLRSLGALGPPS